MNGATMFSRPTRVARGLVAASTSTLVAALSHAMGGGSFPHPLLLLFGVVFASIVCIGLTGRRVSLFRLAPAVLGSQLLFHLLFSIAPTTVVTGGIGHHAHTALTTASTGGTAPMMLDGGMTVAHLGAALITVLALRFGETAFWGLLDTARLMVARVLGALSDFSIPLPSARVTPMRDRAFVPAPAAHILTGLRRRGPPPSLVLI